MKQIENEDFDKNVYQANLNLMELLVQIPAFKENVTELRKCYNIPLEGFPFTVKGGEQKTEWYINLDEKIEDWCEDINKLHQRCHELKVDKRYRRAIETYVIFNEITAPVANAEVVRHYENNQPSTLSIATYRKPSQKELLVSNELMEIIRNFSEPNKAIVHRPKKNANRDKMILEKSQQRGKKVKTFDEEYKYSSKDIVAEVYPEGDEQTDTRRAANVRQISHRKLEEIKQRIGWL